jgi:uncharacterized phage protein gp47/JayE
MGKITREGYIQVTQDDYATLLGTEYLAIDPEWNIAPDTPDGQLIGIFGETLGLLDEQQGNTYNSFDPDRAIGQALDSLCKICNIERLPAAPSTAVVTATGTLGTVLVPGTLIRSRTLGTEWASDSLATIGSGGTVEVPLTCTEDGPNQADSLTLTEIVNSVAGLDSVTNPAPAVIGRNTEGDTSLRVRRYHSVSNAGASQVDNIYSVIANIPSVLSAHIYENDGAGDDENGFPGHSLTILVEGGGDQEIANRIYYKKSPGCRLYAISGQSVTKEVTSTVTGNKFDVVFNRPDTIVCKTAITIAKPTADIIPQGQADAIKVAIQEYAIGELQGVGTGFNNSGFSIGDDVYASRLYTPVNSVIGHQTPGFYVQSLLLGSGPASSAVHTEIAIGPAEYGVFDPTNIEVTYNNV